MTMEGLDIPEAHVGLSHKPNSTVRSGVRLLATVSETDQARQNSDSLMDQGKHEKVPYIAYQRLTVLAFGVN